MFLEKIFHEFFLKPIEMNLGYNPINTLVYALIIIGLTYFTFGFLKKMKIKIDQKLAISIFPFVIFGSSVRVLEDSNLISGYLFVSPMIWIIFFFFTFLIFSLGIFFERKLGLPYYKSTFIIGFILFALTLGLFQFRNLSGFFHTLLWFLPWIIFLKFIKWSPENKIITGAHMLDAIATFVSIDFFNYSEQHFLPRFIIGFFNTGFSFVILKFIVVVSVLVLLDKYLDDKSLKNAIKIVIFILGLVTGTRDLLRLMCLV